ncbi:hypothetical protein SH2C18_45530 [Clostridium sediminicola]|uniref:CPBP family intramembrane glutamic endopeptidase n=1 Tax=Clostridium sediminicola TaxID=3114879 RepID=UPI0031F2551F
MGKNKKSKIAVRLFAILYLIIGIGDLIGGSAQDSRFYNFDNIFIRIIGVILIVSSIGIFSKKEIARKGIIFALSLSIIEIFIGAPQDMNTFELIIGVIIMLILYVPGLMYFMKIGNSKSNNEDRLYTLEEENSSEVKDTTEDKLGIKYFKLSFLGAIGLFLLYNILIVNIVSIPFVIISDIFASLDYEVLETSLIMIGDTVGHIIMVVLILWRIRKKKQESFKLSFVGELNKKVVLAISCLMIGYFLWFQSSIGILTNKIPLPEFILELVEGFLLNPYLVLFSTTIIAPIFEEIIMRGIILEGFLNKYKHRTAIILSALLFGLFHLNIPQFVNAFIMGIIFGIIYYKTRSLILCIVAHMVNNTFAIIIAGIGFSPSILSFTIGAIIFILAGKYIMNYIRFLDYSKNSAQCEKCAVP